MKLIIDIDEDVRVAITRMGLLRISDEMQKKVDKAIQRGTPIPDSATNGGALKILFPNERFNNEDEWWIMDLDWWNSPYQKGGK